MSASDAMSARDWALIQLDSKRIGGWAARSLRRPRGAGEAPADPRDRALAEQIEIGVVKNLLLLEHLVHHYSGRALKSIDAAVRKIFAVALYQVRFLTRIPAHAAVNEAVEQTKRFGLGRASAFVNAVLRKALREPDAPLPDPSNPQEYARLVLSHPPELFSRLAMFLGTHDAIRFCEHDNREAPTIVRLLPGAKVKDLSGEGVTVQPHRAQGMYVVEGARQSALADWAARGIAQVQDPTAALAVSKLDLSHNQVVLDRCCGLGTKTLQIQGVLGESGRIVAMDASAARTETLSKIVADRHLANIRVRHASSVEELPSTDPQFFNRILIDAPCSNSGVLARRPEARYAQSQRKIESVIKLQDEILDDTIARLSPGGKLVYSTCSVWPEENELRTAAFLQRHPEFAVLEQHTTWPDLSGEPTRYHDGGYYAVFTSRTGGAATPDTEPEPPHSP